jgi:putative heme d1 biosynthesis radical SAM protein NirJ1
MPEQFLQSFKDKKPIVVWNMTRRCNLHCIHCYADSDDKIYKGELTTEEAKKFITDLSEFKIPVLLFSGGEPLIRKDLFELGLYAKKLGIRIVISTNGTLITPDNAKKIRETGFDYVGISLDGIGAVNDKFRGKKGAFEKAMAGFRNCVAVGQKVGLRLTLTKHNYQELPAIFDFIEKEKIDRACFYHLVYSGRGSRISEDDLSNEESRKAIDYIIERTADFHKRGLNKDILTVDNHTDGVYLYLKLKKENPARATEVLKLLQANGGNSSGVAISNVDNLGNVHADQFWQTHTFGNVRERKFGEIWTDTTDPIMAKLKTRRDFLKGRCGRCKWLDICNGNFRVRAEAAHGDPWAEDPACYLTEEEITTR